MKTRLIVELEAPEGATNDDVKEYVECAVRGYIGGEHPDHPMFGLDGASVEVLIEGPVPSSKEGGAKLVSLPVAPSPFDTSIADGAWICEACHDGPDPYPSAGFVRVTNHFTRGNAPSGWGAMGYADPQGVHHVHFAVCEITQYGCGRGHRWQVSIWQKCPACGWQQEADQREPMQDDDKAGRESLARSIELLTPAGMGGLSAR